MVANTIAPTGEFHYCQGYPCYHWSHQNWTIGTAPNPVQVGWQCPGCKTYYAPAIISCTCEAVKVTWTTTDSSNVG